MQSLSPELNWAGTRTYGAERVVVPRSLDEAAQLVAESTHVRGLGTRHSFNDVADGPGTLIDLTALPAELSMDAEGGTAAFTAGSRYGRLAPELDAKGVALHNMGSLPHISVAGATATGTHGSGTSLGSLSTAVRALEFIGPDGGVRTAKKGDDDFDGMVVHLGLLGLVTRVTLDVEPGYRLRQDAYGPMAWESFLAHLPDVFSAGYSVSCFTDWSGPVREILVKSRIPNGSGSVEVPTDLFGAPLLPAAPGDDRRTARDGSPGPWWDRLPHFTIDSVPSVGSEVQSEHFVPLDHGPAALEAVASLEGRIRPHLHVAELRTMAADDLWLSPTQGRDVLCIAFTWKKHPDQVAALLPDLEAAIAPFEARPHWGKLSSLDADAVEALYPRLDEFRALVARQDPGGKFRSGFGGRALRL